MCGLFGSVGLPADNARIDIVSHRGPDGRGLTSFDSPSGPVVLAHRRLAIIDVSDDGLQPMTDPSGRYAIVLNGEIYNYLELRAELQSRGERFHTQSDTEVLLRAFVVWGEAALARLRGMFAFLIWDNREKRVFAVRDRFGIKPLYYARGPHGIAFGSEIKQLLGLPGVSGRMNISRVADFLESGISDHTAETMFEGVHQLRAGECATVDAGTNASPSMRLWRWYELPGERLHASSTEAAGRFRDLLDDAVRLHLRSDVPVGSCLSGGLDSSSIVCLMAEMLGSSSGGTKVKTVSACYVEKSVDEKPFMDAVVSRANTDPHFIWPRAEDVFQRACDITWHQDEPFGSTSIFAQWCVFAEARRAGVKVMLDGQGADEQLGGYVSGFPFHLAGLCRRGDLLAVYRTIIGRSQASGVPWTTQLRELAPQMLPPRVLAWLYRPRQTLVQRDWVGNGVLRHNSSGKSAFQIAIDERGLLPAHDLASLCVIMTLASNLQMLLHWEDRNSMAHSIEARVPFLDHPLVEFSLALGNEHKMVDGTTKHVLRRAMCEVLPPMVRDRHDKLGFATPEQIWFRGPLRGLVEDGLEETLRRYRELLNAPGVRLRAADMLDGRRPVDFWLWRIVNLGIWGKCFGVSL